MGSGFEPQLDLGRLSGRAFGGRARFFFLIVVFNVLLLAMLLLSLQQGELKRELIILNYTKTEYEERIRTELITTTRVVTVVVTPAAPMK